MASFSLSIEQGKQVYNCEAKNVGVVYNEWDKSLTYRHRGCPSHSFCTTIYNYSQNESQWSILNICHIQRSSHYIFLMFLVNAKTKNRNTNAMQWWNFQSESIKALWLQSQFVVQVLWEWYPCRCLLTNCLLGKAAKLCLANSWNNSGTTTKYIEYI